MDRPSMTVEMENGTRYGADTIQAVSKDGEPAIAFVCSGEVTQVAAEDVAGIHVGSERTCMHCTR